VTTVDDKTQKKNIRKMPNYTVEVATSFFAFTNEIYGKVEQVQVPSFPKQIAIEDVQANNFRSKSKSLQFNGTNKLLKVNHHRLEPPSNLDDALLKQKNERME